METGKSILHCIFDGEYFPMEHIAPQQPEYRTQHQKIGEEMLYFSELLQEEDKKRFEELHTILLEVQDMEYFAAYAEGFRVGVLLMMENVHQKQ